MRMSRSLCAIVFRPHETALADMRNVQTIIYRYGGVASLDFHPSNAMPFTISLTQSPSSPRLDDHPLEKLPPTDCLTKHPRIVLKNPHDPDTRMGRVTQVLATPKWWMHQHKYRKVWETAVNPEEKISRTQVKLH
ncbi:hypothetical protein PMAYCL1PPCAC_10036 [Pristionchus mayeri]|uniref:Uncharacterized protein n=1 Tax=Pristionchus mayeri TaxID=1317129 RepID=A0AAN4ZFH5_9BILA|nr:hypothetical protein PMAYCL1PPCAC_10036 [Pristionchus mayeri]